jgi:hypothetical protein
MSSRILIARKYKISDSEILQTSQALHDNFERYKSDFTGYSALFDDPFGVEFQAAIDFAYSLARKNSDFGYMATLSSAVESKLEECRAHFRKLGFYLRTIWGDNGAVLNDFKRNEYSQRRNLPLKFADLLLLANSKSELPQYKAELLAAGFGQADIDELATLAAELQAAKRVQEEWKSAGAVRSERRIESLNVVWAIMKKISEASRDIYVHSPAMRVLFAIYPAKKRTAKIKTPVG